MNDIVFFTISAAVFLASIVMAVVFSRNVSKKANRFIRPFYLLFAGVFIATFILLVPVYDSVCGGTSFHLLKTVFFSAQGTIQVFTANADSSIIYENLPGSIGGIPGVYSALLSFLYVLAPVLTFGFVISFFKNASAYVKLFFQSGKDFYVFSELNEKSIALAADIRKNHPRCAIVFADVFGKDEEQTFELMKDAEALGGICFKKSILDIRFLIHNSSKDMYFFVIGIDETENVDISLKLISIFGNIPNTYLYAFSTRIESTLLLSQNQGTRMKVRRVNEVRSLISRILYDSGTDLFKNAVQSENGEKTIHAVIVGLGNHGTEMMKALTWYCQMDGYHIVIDAYDSDALAEEKVAALCPELMSENYNGMVIPGETEYTIRIHSGVDVKTASFAESISHMQDVSYVLVALGSDEKNIETAVYLRMLFARASKKPAKDSMMAPVIQSIVWSSDEVDALRDIVIKELPYNIDFIGDLRTSFTEKVVIDSDVERDALSIHCDGDKSKEESFWAYEYNYCSSVACAIHMKAKKFCNVPGARKPRDQWTDDEKKAFQTLEHRRWNAYMRSEGYVFSGSKEESSRNDLAKMHYDLVDFSSLSEEEKRKDSRVGNG